MARILFPKMSARQRLYQSVSGVAPFLGAVSLITSLSWNRDFCDQSACLIVEQGERATMRACDRLGNRQAKAESSLSVGRARVVPARKRLNQSFPVFGGNPRPVVDYTD